MKRCLFGLIPLIVFLAVSSAGMSFYQAIAEAAVRIDEQVANGRPI